MKQRTLIAWMLGLLSICCSQFANAGESVNVVNFSKQQIRLDTTMNGTLSVSFVNRDYSYPMESDGPALPLISMNVPIPANTSFQNCAIRVVKKEKISEKINIALAPVPVPTSEPSSYVASKEYYVGSVVPSATLHYSFTSKYVKGNIVHLNMCPFEYNSSTKDLYLVTGLILEVNYSIPSIASTPEDVYNPEMDETFRNCINIPIPSSLGFDFCEESSNTIQLKPASIDCAIITSKSLQNAFKNYQTWKTSLGVRTQIYTVEDIADNTSGADIQEKIKRHIQKLKKENNLKYVLLGGDDSKVPTRQCFVSCGEYTAYTPADNYYICFEEPFNWDGNGNGIYGEAQDSIDFSTELFISRLPVRTSSEVSNYTNNLVKYIFNGNKSAKQSNMLLAGVKLWNNYSSMSDAYWKGEKLYSEFIEPYWDGTRIRFYDTYTDFPGGSQYHVTPSNLQEQFALGYSFVDFMTHGNTTIWGTESSANYTSSLASSLKNSGATMITTMACLTNAFDSQTDPCLSEAFIRNEDSGVLTYLGSSRYGWGLESKDLGASLQYESVYYENLFNPDVKYKNFAKLVASAKMAFMPYCSSNTAQRWLQMSLNAIGDPELYIYTTVPPVLEDPKLSYANGLLTVNSPNEECCITVSSLNDAGSVYYKSVKNVVKGTTFSGVDSDVTISLTNPGSIPVLYTGTLSDHSMDLRDRTMTFEKINMTSPRTENRSANDDSSISYISSDMGGVVVNIHALDTNKNLILKVSDLTGYTVFRSNIADSGNIQVSIKDLNPGLYIVSLLSGDVILDQAKFTCKY